MRRRGSNQAVSRYASRRTSGSRLRLEFLALRRERFRLAPDIRPFYGYVVNRAGLLCRLQKMKRLQQHATLKAAMKRDAEVMPHWPRQENRTRSLDLFRHVAGDGNRDGRDTASLDRALDQSDGLMADRSSGGEQCSVSPFLLNDGLGDIVGYRAFKLLRVHVVADEAEEIAAQSAQHAFGGQFLKTLDGKDDVDIHVGVVMRIFQLMDDQVLVTRCRGNAAEPEIAKRVADVEGRIALRMYAAGAD